MTQILLTKLGALGLITDVPPAELPPNAWTGAQNVRFVNQTVQRVFGQTAIAASSMDNWQPPYWLMQWSTPQGILWFVAGETGVFTLSGASAVDVTRASGGYTSGSVPKWNGGILGGVPVLNNSGLVDPPQCWDGTSRLINLPNWPFASSPSPTTPRWRASVVRPFGNYLVALDLYEDEGLGAVRYPTKLRWSSPAEPGSIPGQWIPSPTNLAGSASMSTTTDFLVDCLPLGGVNILYKEDTTHMMQLVGGGLVFDLKQIFPEFGLLSQHCVRAFKGQHFVLAKEDVVVHNGQTYESVIDGVTREHLFAALDPEHFRNSFVVDYPRRNEMWVCVPVIGSDDPRCTRAYIWNWKSGTWTIRDIPALAYATPGVFDIDSGPVFLDSITTLIDDYSGVFDYVRYNPAKLKLLFARPTTPEEVLALVDSETGALLVDSETGAVLVDSFGTHGKIYEGETTGQFDGANFTSFVERTGLALSPAFNDQGFTVDTQSVKFFRRMYPKIRADQGVVLSISVGAQDFVDAPVRWDAAREYDPNSESFVDLQFSGRAMAYRFESSSGGWWELSSIGLDLSVVSKV